MASRPELPIRLEFQKINGQYEDLILHQIPESINKHDISAFLKYELGRIRDEYNLVVQNRRLPSDWPGSTNLRSLVKMVVPLFILAATICRFINNYRLRNPDEQLMKILKYLATNRGSKLDATYLPVLD